MTALWLIICLIAVLIAALLMRARRESMPIQRSAFDLQIYRDQLREVARDNKRGLLSDEQAAAATTEIERRILTADANRVAPGTDSPLSRSVTAVVAVAVPVAALFLYLQLGTPHAPDMPFAGRDITNPEPQQVTDDAPQMTQMIARLKQRLRQSPEDAQGWLLLARSFLTVERFDAAVQAFDKAIRFGGREPYVLSGFLEARVMAAGGRIDDSLLALTDEILSADPTNAAALHYTGLGREQKNDLRGALQAWVDLSAVTPIDAPWIGDVRRRIDAAATALGITPGSITLSESVRAALAAAPAAPGPTREDMNAAAQMSPEDRQEMIHNMVQGLLKRLKENPNDLNGWVMLERSYRVMGDIDKADETAEHIKAMGGAVN